MMRHELVGDVTEDQLAKTSEEIDQATPNEEMQ